MNKLLLDKKVLIIKNDENINLSFDHENIEIDIFSKNLKNREIFIEVNNDTNLLINYASFIHDDCNVNINVLVKGNNNIVNIRKRCISINNVGNITCNIKALSNTSENILVEDLKGIIENGSIVFIPTLEIETMDVEASHFATIGSLNKDELFYLQNKGISYNNACLLLKEKFIFNIFRKEIKEEFKKEE